MVGPIVIEGDDADGLWRAAVSAVLDGEAVRPRGMPTMEVMSAVLHLRNVRQRLVLSPGRRVNPVFAVAEAVWVLAAAPDAWIYRYNKRLQSFADDGDLRGAYGPRLRRWRGEMDQLAEVRRRLRDDPASRQGVVQIYDPTLDQVGNRDVACTIGWRFLSRSDGLRMHSTMRSNDLWLGCPYDIFTATVVQEVMAGWLHLPPAAFVQFTDSLHLYERDVALASAALDVAVTDPAPPTLGPLAVPFDQIDELLQHLLDDDPVHGCGGWDDVSRVLRAHQARREGRPRDAVLLADQVEGSIALALDQWFGARDV